MTTETVSNARGVTAASWLIRIMIVMHLCGIATLIYTWGSTAIGNVAFMEWDCDPAKVFTVEKIAIVVMLLIAGSLLVRPTVTASVIVGCAVLLETCAAYRFGGSPFINMVLASSSLRYMAPFALAALIALPGNAKWDRYRYQTCAWILRMGIAIVFIAHGLQALFKHPQFIDLIIGSTRRLTGYHVSESQAVILLKLIGTQDVLVAALVLCKRWKMLLIEMAIWGLITAMSRVTAAGPLSYYEVLLRTSHFLAPLAVMAMAGVLDAQAIKSAVMVEQSAPAATNTNLAKA